MKNQTCNKIALLLTGVLGRMQDNADFFVGIDIEYKSGTKLFKAVILPVDGKFEIKYNGVTTLLMQDDIAKTVVCELEKYEGVIITYRERGATIIIEGCDKAVTTKQIDSINEVLASNAPASRDYIIKIGQADKLLCEIGIMSKDGKLKNDMLRKYSQIDHFVELVVPVIDALDANKQICVLDCGCGKSYLSFVLNFYMREIKKLDCKFVGIDYSQSVIDASVRMAKNLGYNNMEFICADINSYVPSAKIDLLISLHACDTATDMAIGLGIRSGVNAIVAVPCCHKQMLSQYDCEPLAPLIVHPIFKARLADTLTDAMRVLLLEGYGYDVTAMEYISPLETPKNLMIKAVKRWEQNSKKLREYRDMSELFGVSLSLEQYSNWGTKRIV